MLDVVSQLPLQWLPMITRLLFALAFSLVISASAAAAPNAAPAPASNALPDAKRLEQMAARFARTGLTADLSKLSADDRRVLAKLVEASKIIDGIFLGQVWMVGAHALLQVDSVIKQLCLPLLLSHHGNRAHAPWLRSQHREDVVFTFHAVWT